MTDLTPMQSKLCEESGTDYSDLKAFFINCTLKRSPEVSNTQGLMDISMEIMRATGSRSSASARSTTRSRPASGPT
jgi:hypothetical protein